MHRVALRAPPRRYTPPAPVTAAVAGSVAGATGVALEGLTTAIRRNVRRTHLVAASSSSIAMTANCSHHCPSRRFAGDYEARVARGGGGNAAAPLKGSPASAAAAPVDPARIAKSVVWGLWNEGNLFSLTVPEMQAFLTSVGITPDEKQKKTVLVRQMEDYMAKEQPPAINKEASLKEDPADVLKSSDATNNMEDGSASSYSSRGADLFEESDDYGDWGVEPNFESRAEHDFMALSTQGLYQDSSAEPLSCRAFQLLHEGTTADVVLSKIDCSNLPGCQSLGSNILHVHNINPNDANRQRFRRSFKWACQNMWHSNLDGEVNIGAGKALYWRRVARRNRNILPIWTCQEHLHTTHPYTWFAVAHETNTAAVEKFAAALGMKPTGGTAAAEPVTSYKTFIKRSRDFLDVELNQQLQVTMVRKPWDRYLCAHVLREKMPDLRFLVRARVNIKKKVADAYYEARIIQQTADSSFVSQLPPELGDVIYTCERKIRKWSTFLPSGVKLQLVETKRTPLIVTRKEDDGDRLEYELIATVPQQGEQLDTFRVADELWKQGEDFASILEEGMQELHGFSMPAAAAFDAAVLQSK